MLKALAEAGSFTASEVAAADPRADERDVARAIALLTWSGDIATQPEQAVRITDQGLARLDASRTWSPSCPRAAAPGMRPAGLQRAYTLSKEHA